MLPRPTWTLLFIVACAFWVIAVMQGVSSTHHYFHESGDTVLSLSISGAPAHALMYYSQTKPASRFFSMWMMPYLWRSDESEDHRETQEYLLSSTFDDLSQNKPKLLLVSPAHTFTSNTNTLDLLEQDELIAKLLSRYEHLATWGVYEAYTLKSDSLLP